MCQETIFFVICVLFFNIIVYNIIVVLAIATTAAAAVIVADFRFHRIQNSLYPTTIVVFLVVQSFISYRCSFYDSNCLFL